MNYSLQLEINNGVDTLFGHVCEFFDDNRTSKLSTVSKTLISQNVVNRGN